MAQPTARQAVARIAQAILETVAESQPAPESLIHLALQSSLGLTSAQCAQMIEGMIQAGLLERSNHQLSLAETKGTRA